MIEKMSDVHMKEQRWQALLEMRGTLSPGPPKCCLRELDLFTIS